jgi:RNA binding exosome subunit
MNITETEIPFNVVAKICSCNDDQNSNDKKKVIYSFVDGYHNLCIDKKDVRLDEMKACEQLLKHVVDKADKRTIEREVAELKTTLDIMS